MDPPPVQYVTSDSYSIAYAVSGEGVSVVQISAPFSHLQLSWEHPTHQPILETLTACFRLVRYDSRGHGMSTRGLAPESISVTHLCLDLERVVDRLGLDRFVLLGPGHVGHVGILYAVRHPERVQALVLLHCGLTADFYPAALFETLPFQNWDVFLRNLLPRGMATAEHQASLQRLRETFTQADFQTYMSAIDHYDSRQLLPRLRAPTLVLQARDFPLFPEAESMRLASQIEGARFKLIPGEGLYGDTRALVDAIQNFLAALPESRHEVWAAAGLSQREVEVLRLIAGGRSNQQIADALVISPSTVLHHVTNILTKTGCSNRTEAAVYARDRGIA
jgi:pimeloyl-ACP methyl ester carboxylesterase/DNA-binding CsgD family transcriptional regulator